MQDNTAKWGVRKLTKFKENSGIPVGFEYFSTNPNIPAGSLPLFGGEYSRTVYADLWAWVQEQAGYLLEESVWQEKSAANSGNVPFYSTGNGTTTFRVPSLKCWVKGANGIEEVGSYLSAGLPNITGNFSDIAYQKSGGAYATGAFYKTTATEGYMVGGGTASTDFDGINFDASRSSSIYGNSDTVQPKSIVGMWLVKAYGTVTNVGSTDVANIAQGLTELENRVTPIANGGTGATTANQARVNLGANDFVTGLSVSGKTITYNKKDGTSGTITTQDTVPARYITSKYSNGNDWYEVYNDGWVRQGGYVTWTGDRNTVTFQKPFANTNYSALSNQSHTGGFRDGLAVICEKKTTGCIVRTFYGQFGGANWIAEGYGA